MIPGKEVKLGDRTFTMPPIPFLALKKHKALLARMIQGDVDPVKLFETDFDGLFDCVYLTLKRNYPALTEEELGALMDLANLKDAIGAMMGGAGFEEKSASGEPQPAKS